MKKENLNNIKSIFSQKTGVQLRKQRLYMPVKVAVAATLFACFMTVSAFAYDLFNSFHGDNLALASEYAGNGIVEIQVENRSDKALIFQEKLKLRIWSSGEDVEAISSNIRFENTDFEAGESGIMTIDLSEAYDITSLERPLADDRYYFILTNNNFLFGQDWICSVNFSEPIKTEEQKADYKPQIDAELVSQIEPELREYFESFYVWPSNEAIEQHNKYLIDMASLFENRGISPVSPVKPIKGSTWVGGEAPEEESADFRIVSENEQICCEQAIFDVDRKLLAGELEKALAVSAYMPTDSPVNYYTHVPLLYIFVYPKEEALPENSLFVHGKILRFEDIGDKLVYDDGEYVCYELSEYVYSDYAEYYRKISQQRGDIPYSYNEAETLRQYALDNIEGMLERW